MSFNGQGGYKELHSTSCLPRQGSRSCDEEAEPAGTGTTQKRYYHRLRELLLVLLLKTTTTTTAKAKRMQVEPGSLKS